MSVISSTRALSLDHSRPKVAALQEIGRRTLQAELASNAKLTIMDEPTAALGVRERLEVDSVRVAAGGKGVVDALSLGRQILVFVATACAAVRA